MHKYFFILIFCIFSKTNFGQYVPVHTSSKNIYIFLDETANEGYIDLTSVIKPYSRSQIYLFLNQLDKYKNSLSLRQQQELQFYLSEYALEKGDLPLVNYVKLINKDKSQLSLLDPSYKYVDSNFTLKLNPILGMHILSNKNGKITQRWYGAEFFATISKNFSFYASLKDFSNNGELLSKGFRNQKLKSPFTKKDTTILVSQYLNNFSGGAYKVYDNRADYSEMRGGIFYNWKWGYAGIAKDQIIFGDGYNSSNILSGKCPTFPMIKFYMKPTSFLEFNWFHGWLVSNVIDSTNYYLDNTGKKLYRYYNKYISSNMFTITPFKNFKFSFGNSIIYAEKNINLGYMIPFLFYKSVDHTLTMGTENQNSQLFFNISSRNIKHLHLYGSVFFDEIKWSRFSPDSKEKNPLSYKVGSRLSGWPLKNCSATIEYTKTSIVTYNHSIPALTYTSNNYSLGHYLGDNSSELYVDFSYRPIRGLNISVSYTDAKHGNQYSYLREDILTIISEKFMKDIVWSSKELSLKLVYEIFTNTFAVAQYDIRNINGYDLKSDLTRYEVYTKGSDYLNMYTPLYLQGKTNTLTIGLSFGL